MVRLELFELRHGAGSLAAPGLVTRGWCVTWRGVRVLCFPAAPLASALVPHAIGMSGKRVAEA